MNKIASRSVVYALLIFVAGAATGLLLGPLLGRPFMRPPTPEQMSDHLMSRLQSHLDLTPEQSAQIRPIIDETGRDIQGIWVSTTIRVSARVDQSNEEIARHLTAEQIPKMERFVAEGREQMRKRGLRPPPPPPSQ